MVTATPAILDVRAGDLAGRIRMFLHEHHLPILRRLTVEVAGDAVTIQGRVGSFYERQLAIECCKRVAGVRRVVDQIDVDTTA